MKDLTKTMVILVTVTVLSPARTSGGGIAARYPGDRGIEDDPAVVFTESFDGGSIDAIAKRWESVRAHRILSLSPNVPAGSSDGAPFEGFRWRSDKRLQLNFIIYFDEADLPRSLLNRFGVPDRIQ